MGHLSYFHVLITVDATFPGRVLGLKEQASQQSRTMPRTKHHLGKTEMFFLHLSCLGLLDITNKLREISPGRG